MKAIRFISLVSAIVLTGCVHTHTLRQTEQDFASLNKRAQKQNATVVLNDGQRFTVEALHLAVDSTSWINPETGAYEVVSTTDVNSIRFNAREMSAITGLAVGAMGGLLLGGAIGYALGDDSPGTWMRWSARDKAQVMGLLVGVPRALIGLAFGMGEDVYRPVYVSEQGNVPAEVEQ